MAIDNKLDVVVSLTTWAGRINEPTLPKVLFRLIDQQNTKYNYKVVLVLSTDEFGDNYELPPTLELLTHHDKFEIIWTKENTKALKKLDPTMEKYPDLPIITMDDDELVTMDCIEKIMTEHKKTPNMILGGICGVCNGVMRVGYIRLFPPHSLASIPTEYFKSYFQYTNDDEWNGIRANLKHTKSRKMDCKVIVKMNYGNQTNAFRKVYNKFNFKRALLKFKSEHKEFF